MKEFILDLDKPRKLIFDYDAIEKLGERFDIGASSTEIMSKMDLTAGNLPAIIAIGLIWEEPDLKEDVVKKLLNISIQEGKYAIIDHMEIVTQALVYQQTGKEISIKEKLSETLSATLGIGIKDSENLPQGPSVQTSKKKGN